MNSYPVMKKKFPCMATVCTIKACSCLSEPWFVWRNPSPGCSSHSSDESNGSVVRRLEGRTSFSTQDCMYDGKTQSTADCETPLHLVVAICKKCRGLLLAISILWPRQEGCRHFPKACSWASGWFDQQYQCVRHSCKGPSCSAQPIKTDKNTWRIR